MPYGFDGAFTITVPASGSAQGGFDIVRHQNKREPPLSNMRGGGGAQLLTVIAEVTFYGTRSGRQRSVGHRLDQHQLRGFRRPVVMRTSTRSYLLALVTLSAACSVQETPIPVLSGPSELALRIAMQVTPDEILQDGTSQASLIIDVASVDGRPSRGHGAAHRHTFEGVIQDFGTLSAKTVVTGEDGRARVVYTAPARPAQPVDDFNVVTFQVTPIGTDFRGEVRAYGAAPPVAARRHPAAQRGAGAGLHAHAVGADGVVERRL